MSKLLVALMLVLAFSACTNSEQAEERARQERREAEMLRLQEEQRRSVERAPQEEAPAEPEEPATPPEPEYEDKEYYKFDGTECEQYEVTACGVNFYRCANHMIYECFTNVKYTTITKKVLVE